LTPQADAAANHWQRTEVIDIEIGFQNHLQKMRFAAPQE
jgi:hypothetical protein